MIFNAQDAFAQLVEDVRIGQVGHPVAVENPAGTRFVPYRPEIDLNIPVFHIVGEHHKIPVPEALAAWHAIMDKTFHLPYPRCALLMSLPGTHPGLRHLMPRFHVRHTYVTVFEEDDEELHITPFMTNDRLDHWVRQLFNFDIMFGTDEAITTYDPSWGSFPLDFITNVEISLWDRLQGNLAFLHQLMTRKGAATKVSGSLTTEKINARRSKMGLPSVPGVIAIDLDRAPEPSGTGVSRGAGIPKKPHFRRGSWHTRKATGKSFWHGPAAVHGGSGVVPPWYEVRT